MMKKSLLLSLLIPLTTFADFGKPELLARFMSSDAWRAPDNLWCFTSNPAILKGKVYLTCMDEKGRSMVEWSPEYKIIARAEMDNFFSSATVSMGKVSWYEYNEFNSKRFYDLTSTLKVTEVDNLETFSTQGDTFLPLTSDSWFFRAKGEKPQIMIWRQDEIVPFFNPGASYIFTPQVSNDSIAMRTREQNYNENAPDRLWLYHQGSWKVILEDRDANPESPWKIIRQSLALDGDEVVVIADRGQGEELLLIKGTSIKSLARAGKDLARFDYFNLQYKAGTIAVRGEDFERRKVLYVYTQKNGFRPLLTQGDVVHTDLAIGRVHYSNRDAILYSAPGIDEEGNVYQQATLTEFDYPTTLLGVGLLKFSKQ